MKRQAHLIIWIFIIAIVAGCTKKDSEDYEDVLVVNEFPKPGLSEIPVVTDLTPFTGKKYYIDDVETNGDGSELSPFNDINNALAIVQPGDHVIVKSGTFEITSRIATKRHGEKDKPIIIRAADLNNRPIIIRSSDVLPAPINKPYGGEVFLIRHMYYVIDGFIIDGAFGPEVFSMNYPVVGADYNEKAYRNLVVFAHYGAPVGSPGSKYSLELELGYNGDNSILRNCEVKNNRVDGIAVAADNIIIDNCEIHHCLRGSELGPIDAHGIIGSHCTNLTVQRCNIHQNSGDCIQVDPDIANDCGTKLWDNLTVKDCELWTAPLETACADWSAGFSPGENGIDTKTFTNEAQITHRPKVTVTNLLVHGFSQVPFFSNRSVFNVKFRTDWTFNGITAYDNQFVFRMRGEENNAEQGGAYPTLYNVLAYDNYCVFRFERMIKNVTISHCTLGSNTNFFYHDQAENDELGRPWAVDKISYALTNCLFLSEQIPYEAYDPTNMAVGAETFVNAASYNFRLKENSIAIDAATTIRGLSNDISGLLRIQGSMPDAGAYEWGN